MTGWKRVAIFASVVGVLLTAWIRAPRTLWYGESGPTRLGRATTSFMAWYSGIGLPPQRQVALDLRGRKTGQKRTLPVVVARVDGERYLVSMMGGSAAWVLNARADSLATVRHGRREDVRLVEVSAPIRAAVLQEYLRLAPGARPFFPVDKDAPLEDFAAIVDRFPVFRIEPI